MSSSSNSLYIPSVKMSYTVDKIVFLFWRLGFGKVDRVDFVPIVKTNDKECIHFKQAFLYVDPKSAWHPDIVKSIEQGAPYKVYPSRDETFQHLRDEKEYWLILKNKSPVPYATTTLNVHQLVNNLSELEARLAEMEEQLIEKEARFAEKEAECRILKWRIETNNFTEDDEVEEEIKAKEFVTSFNNILQMVDPSYDDDGYEEYSLSDRFNDEIDGLVQDGDDDDDEKIMCVCDICGENKILTAYGWRAADEKLCSECFLSAPMN